jgi:lysophospholipase L1-like esterase
MGDAEIVPERAKRVAVVGDSIVGYQNGYYTRKLNEYGLGVKFDQFGASGDTTEGMKKRLPGIVSSGKYSELILAGGVNDLAIGGGGNEGNWKKNFQKFENNIREMIKIAKRNGIEKILLVEVAPWGGSQNSSAIKEERTLEYNRMLAKVAEETGAVLVPVHKIMEGERGKLKEQFTWLKKGNEREWLHPGERGLEMIAKRIAEAGYKFQLMDKILNEGYQYEKSGDYLARLKGKQAPGRIASRY